MRSPTSHRRRAALAAALASAALLAAGTAPAYANVPLTRVSADPFTNPDSEHATEVEPDTFAYGSTVVSAFQVGRYFDGGATDIGVVRSTDGGATWGPPGFLNLTSTAGNASSPYPRASDPAVAYDAAHDVWLVISLPILPDISSPAVLVSRSTDGGATFGPAVTVPPPAAPQVDLDKIWIACDNGADSPFRGHCYAAFDNFAANDTLVMSTSTDGGLTWSVPAPTTDQSKGLGGQPVVRPDGTVVVPYNANSGAIRSFRSTDGGATWSRSVKVSGVKIRFIARLRASQLPSAEIAGDGTVYVAWQDCRFRLRCAANDIVFSRSDDGLAWTAPQRIPLDDVDGPVNDVIPGLAVDPSTSGSSTHLALTYYTARCTLLACRLGVGYTSSPDGGAHWAAPTMLAGPMWMGDTAATSQGRMVGDYISTSFVNGMATSVFAVGLPKHGSTYDEGMYAPATPLPVASATEATLAASGAGAAAAPESAPEAPAARAR